MIDIECFDNIPLCLRLNGTMTAFILDKFFLFWNFIDAFDRTEILDG